MAQNDCVKVNHSSAVTEFGFDHICRQHLQHKFGVNVTTSEI